MPQTAAIITRTYSGCRSKEKREGGGEAEETGVSEEESALIWLLSLLSPAIPVRASALREFCRKNIKSG
ncbi:MAG: hypothetical protein OHK0029_08680 [Armatimonadaceae bacterium]